MRRSHGVSSHSPNRFFSTAGEPPAVVARETRVYLTGLVRELKPV